MTENDSRRKSMEGASIEIGVVANNEKQDVQASVNSKKKQNSINSGLPSADTITVVTKKQGDASSKLLAKFYPPGRNEFLHEDDQP